MLIGFLAALFVGILAGLGVGSGGIFMLYLTLLTDMPHKIAQGVNLLFFVFALAGATPFHLTKYRIPPKIFAVIFLCGMPGALLGALLVPSIPVGILRKGFGFLLVISGVLTFFKKERIKPHGRSENNTNKMAKKEGECLTNKEETDIM